jgi:hypothetical protein
MAAGCWTEGCGLWICECGCNPMTRIAVKSPHGLSCVDKGLMVKFELAMHFLACDAGIPIGV